MSKLTVEIAIAAIAGFEGNIEKLREFIANETSNTSLPAASGGTPSSGNVAPREESKRRPMSVKARASIAKAQKARWAKFHQDRATPDATPISEVAKPRKKFSAATRKRMAEAQKRRYATANKGKTMSATG